MAERWTDQQSVDAWAASGAMALTGRPHGPPLGPPAPLVPRLRAVADRIEARSTAIGNTVRVDPIALLAERASIAGLRRQGQISCGGGCHLLRGEDGWLAVSLVRPQDVELLPAWLGIDPVGRGDDPWDPVQRAIALSAVDSLADRAADLGLPVGVLAGPPPADSPERPDRWEKLGDCPPARALADVVVADLGALWAGPLCGALLAQAGAQVVKVESTRRPDGVRLGPAAFNDLLNAGKRSVALDFTIAQGRDALLALLERVDVVIDTARPRGLQQMGIDAHALMRAGRPSVWLSITGHGATGPPQHRVGFGDDAAVAGGLVVWDDHQPMFCADAVADPATGMVAAAAVLDALVTGGRWHLDVALSTVAAHLAGPTLPVSHGTSAQPPKARDVTGTARALGDDTTAVLTELGVSTAGS